MNRPGDSLARHLLIGGLVTAAVVVALMIWVDVPLAQFFEDYRQTWWMHFFNAITNFASGYIWYPVAVIGLGATYIRHRRSAPNPVAFTRAARAWTFMIVNMASSGIFVNAVKLAVGRERPRLLFRDGTTGFHPFGLDLADCSFPSGHTQSIWTAMLALWFIYPPGRALFVLVAVMISASRVIISAHYAGDVAAGFYVAVAATVLWRRWFERGGVPLSLAAPPSAESSAGD